MKLENSRAPNHSLYALLLHAFYVTLLLRFVKPSTAQQFVIEHNASLAIDTYSNHSHAMHNLETMMYNYDHEVMANHQMLFDTIWSIAKEIKIISKATDPLLLANALSDKDYPKARQLLNGTINANVAFYDQKSQQHLPIICSFTHRGDVPAVEVLLQAGAHSQVVCSGLTPLAMAAFAVNTPMIELLVKHGADPNYETVPCTNAVFQLFDFTALRNTTTRVSAERISNALTPMVNAGANLDYQCSELPLAAVAIQYERVDVIRALCENGFDVNKKIISNTEFFGNGSTLLHMAAVQGAYESAVELVRCGASLSAKNAFGIEPFFMTIMGNNPKLSQLLLHDKIPKTMLEPMLQPEVPQAIRDLIKSHLKARKPQRKTAKSTKRLNKDLITALYAPKANADKIEALLNDGASANAIVTMGDASMPILCLAAQNSSADILELFVRYGANVNTKRCLGGTPLLLAVQYNTLAAIKVLLNAHADPNIPPSVDTTLCLDAVGMILTYQSAAFDESANRGAVKRSLQERELLLEAMITAGGKIDKPCASGLSRAHLSARVDSADGVNMLAKHGANLNALVDETRKTPLHLAANSNALEAAAALIKHGAKLNPKDATGQTPLDYSLFKRNLNMTKLLLATNTDTNSLQQALNSKKGTKQQRELVKAAMAVQDVHINSSMKTARM